MVNSGGSALSVSVEIPRLCCRWISAAHAFEGIIVLIKCTFKINWKKNKLLFHLITIIYRNCWVWVCKIVKWNHQVFVSPLSCLVQRQTSLTGENCLLCGQLQVQEKGKSWAKMWAAVTKAEPLVLYLQNSGQVRVKHAHALVALWTSVTSVVSCILSADPPATDIWPWCTSCLQPSAAKTGHLYGVAHVHISERVWVSSIQSCLCRAVYAA